MKLTFWALIKDQLTKVPPLVKQDLKGKTIIVTGANVGLGLEAAKHFARMNPGKLIVTCRSQAKAEETLSKIRKETGCEVVEAWVLDLAEFSSVKAFVARFEEEGGDRLDILLENAAVSLQDLTFTKDGWETSAQVNSIATSLLALLLLPRMLETAEKYDTTPRLAVATSELHYLAKLTREDVEVPNFFRKWAHKEYLTKLNMHRYPETKLMNVLFVRALNDRLPHKHKHKHKPLIVTAPNPGMCVSALRRNLKFPVNVISRIADVLLARTSEQGGRLFVLAAIGGGEGESFRGAYLSVGQPREPSDVVLGQEGRKVQDKLWNDLIEELSVVEPKITHIVKDYLTEPVPVSL